MHRVFKPLHLRRAQGINRRHAWSGHLWQGRFFSSPLDKTYLWFCVRDVERNPIRAGLVERAQDYPWSSAKAHCGLLRDDVLATKSPHWYVFEDISDWAARLTDEDDDDDGHLRTVRRNIQKNLPCGSDTFIERLERQTGRALRFRPVGRPGKG